MRKLFFLFFVLLSVTVRSVVVDGINYEFDSTYKNSKKLVMVIILVI